MKLMLDMNMSPLWLPIFADAGVDAVHWAEIGPATASDREIMGAARSAGAVVFTHDLDFGIALALSGDAGPSVIQLRDQDILPGANDDLVVGAIKSCESELQAGALLTIDSARFRVTSLPLRR